ncbi:hypothetical protein AL060_07645 [Pseudomonas syringae pv. rhaphiolepidis]|nr:hypothetical protein AL060_07645 [Pseudomonas syringae pv. rhaphiolepidis]
MKFEQNNPLIDYRPNLILSAAIEIDRLNRIARKSSSLWKALPTREGDDGLVELVNELAYNAIESLVPNVFSERVQQELEKMPIEMHEIIETLSRPIGSALQVLQCQQAQTFLAHVGVEK